MKPIKFRVWDKMLKELHYDAEVAIKNGKITYVSFCDGEAHLSASDYLLDMPDKTQRFIIDQFTGLQDKNGNEIYEGDIVKLPLKYDGVTTNLYHEVMYKSDKYYCGWNDGLCLIEGIEIVGNIHESPELLLEKEAEPDPRKTQRSTQPSEGAT